MSSESEGEAGACGRRAGAASQLTLCPAPPRRACCHCDTRASATSGIETSGESGGSSEACWCGVCGGALAGTRVRCVCGAGHARADPLDGLPPALDPLQARLHQIILYQKKVVEELSGQLRSAREALRQSTTPAPPVAPPAAPAQKAAPARGSGSSSGSASEVEVGEEARGVVWLPDSAAPRCQYCRNHFWLARRRHHCRTGKKLHKGTVWWHFLRVVLGDELVGRLRHDACVPAVPSAAVTRPRPPEPGRASPSASDRTRADTSAHERGRASTSAPERSRANPSAPEPARPRPRPAGGPPPTLCECENCLDRPPLPCRLIYYLG
ncbi:unnamed protein product [Chrysodeixis includens]|uniref:FYVE zinc finger domain-containing protein n=1 Tax=Chrysodeixis includens TaxID=689277 RepID=A0A9N8KZM7_CHRIL|nr:unnamed protein product [Chrysodeixis includens]